MSAKTTDKVVGLGRALNELQKYERTVYKEIQNRMAVQANPLAAKVGVAYPASALTHWKSTAPKKRRSSKKPFPVYNGTAVRTGVRPVVRARRPRDGVYNILRLQQSQAGGAVFDSAGSRTNNQFVRNLDTYSPVKGKSSVGRIRSRVLYKAVDSNKPMVETVVRNCVTITDRIVQTSINSR
jgi:hypothetical protein